MGRGGREKDVQTTLRALMPTKNVWRYPETDVRFERTDQGTCIWSCEGQRDVARFRTENTHERIRSNLDFVKNECYETDAAYDERREHLSRVPRMNDASPCERDRDRSRTGDNNKIATANVAAGQ